MVARQLSRKGASSDGRSNSDVQIITITSQITFKLIYVIYNIDKRKQKILDKYITKSNIFNF